MTPDAHDTSGCQLCKHFDNFTKAHSLTPYKDSESGYASQGTDKLKNFLVYNAKLYALGVVSGQAYAKIFETSDYGIPSFTASTTGADSAGDGETYYNLFVEYKGVLYGAAAGTRIWSYTISTNAFVGSALGSLTFSSVSNGIVHSKDDILYFGLDNVVYYKNGAGAITAGLTLPTNLIISSVCEYGNYLAIACRPKYANSVNSKVFLWDRDATLTTVSETIDWGSRDLYVLDNIDGNLIGVSLQNAYSSSFITKLVFSKYSGGGATVFKEILVNASTSVVIQSKQKVNNRLYFGFTGTTIGGTTNDLTGVWSVGKNGEFEPFSVQMDRLPNNDTVATQIKGFFLIQDFMYISYLDGSSAAALSKTNDQVSYASTSIYRTLINQNMPDQDKPKQKQLDAIILTYAPFPTSGQVIVKYKVDNFSYSIVFTKTDDGDASTKVAYEATMDSTVPGPFEAGRDYEFEIDSKGVEITGLYYKYHVLDTQI